MSVLNVFKLATALVAFGLGLLLIMATVVSYVVFGYTLLTAPHPPYFKLMPRW